MKKRIFKLFVLAFLFWASFVFATPSTIYWTAVTADIQPYKVCHITIDNYVTGTGNRLCRWMLILSFKSEKEGWL